jgi:hypothetical protein
MDTLNNAFANLGGGFQYFEFISFLLSSIISDKLMVLVVKDAV